MKLTAQEEYGLRCLLAIARAQEGFLTIKDIADREALTPAYVAKLMRALRMAGLVKSTRGKNGGYELAAGADRINVGEVLSALGGAVYSRNFCHRYAGQQRTCVHNGDCSLRPMWMAIDEVVQRALAQTHLNDLLRTEPAMHQWLKGRPSAEAQRTSP